MITIYGIVTPNEGNWDALLDYGNDKVIPLPRCNDLVNHSPDGFAWGYAGSGPAQLAFAILHASFGEKVARSYYQIFKQAVLARLDSNKPFVMSIDKTEAVVSLMRNNFNFVKVTQ